MNHGVPADHWHELEPGITDINITGFGLHNGQLRVKFRSRTGRESTYQYATSDKGMCCRWEQSSSVGRFFHQFVRPLPYAKIS